MKLAIGCDHGGFELKTALIGYLRGQGHEVTDFGCYDKSSIDYPDYVFPVAEAVVRGEFERGIVICSTGIGVSIAANKVKGVRCALLTDEFSARLTREHNDANMVAFGGFVTTVERAQSILDIWLNTEFSHGERHQRRIDKISKYEETHSLNPNKK
ncbi:MAG: ribose 5-phosphate isomerase B [Eubacteriales bacterium]|nr:ribose 5-phosphate isomerase B [Eubacteriales bacterium]